MSTNTLILVGLSALLLFWAVGAHNRLVRLSNAVAAEHGPIDAHLRLRHLVLEQLAQMCQPLGVAAPITASVRAMQMALEALRARPSSVRELARLIDAHDRIDRELVALWSSQALQQAGASDPGFRQAALAWLDLQSRLAQLIGPHQDSVRAFNDAVAEFPAVLVARLAGLKPLPALDALERGQASDSARAFASIRTSGR